MTTMEDTRIELDVDLELVPHCEIEHEEVPNTCTIEATHVLTACRGPILCCEVAAKLKHRQLGENVTCILCGRSVKDCWRIRPL